MKEIFILWITIQLMFIGYVSVEIRNEMARKDFDCSSSKEPVPTSFGIIVPLAVFAKAAEQPGIIRYCEYMKSQEEK